MSYDAWKTRAPEIKDAPEIEDLYQCDCCGGMVQRDQISMTTTSCGLETFACDGCRGWNK